MRLSGIVGLTVAVAGAAGFVTFTSGTPVLFLNIPSVLICLGLTCSLGLISFGLNDMAHALESGCQLLLAKQPESITKRDLVVIGGLIAPLYSAGHACPATGGCPSASTHAFVWAVLSALRAGGRPLTRGIGLG